MHGANNIVEKYGGKYHFVYFFMELYLRLFEKKRIIPLSAAESYFPACSVAFLLFALCMSCELFFLKDHEYSCADFADTVLLVPAEGGSPRNAESCCVARNGHLDSTDHFPFV
jgi:hypothetical protein